MSFGDDRPIAYVFSIIAIYVTNREITPKDVECPPKSLTPFFEQSANSYREFNAN